MSLTRIDAVAPSSLAGQKTAEVVASHFGQASSPISVPVADASPALFTVTPNGSGQGDILNFRFPNYSANNADNPAAPGSVVVLFATGVGVWDSGVEGAGIALTPTAFRARSVSLTIGGMPTTIFYVGAAPYQTTAKLQINAIVPEDVASGSQPVVLKVGEADNAEQQVTIAIK